MIHPEETTLTKSTKLHHIPHVDHIFGLAVSYRLMTSSTLHCLRVVSIAIPEFSTASSLTDLFINGIHKKRVDEIDPKNILRSNWLLI